MQLAPPLHHTDLTKGTAELIHFGASEVAGVARVVLNKAGHCLRDSDSGFFLGVYSQSLFLKRMIHKAVEV